MTKKHLDPTTIRPELLTEWQEKCAAMKRASDTFAESNAAYHALTASPVHSVAGMSVEDRIRAFAQEDRIRAFAQWDEERIQRTAQRVAARDEATARYLDWHEAQRAFFAVCDQIQHEAAR